MRGAGQLDGMPLPFSRTNPARQGQSGQPQPQLTVAAPSVSMFSLLANLESTGALRVKESVAASAPAAAATLALAAAGANGRQAESDLGAQVCLLSELDSIVKDVTPKHRVEVEANFDLKAFLSVPELMQDQDGNSDDNHDDNEEDGTDSVMRYVRQFAVDQCAWVCPNGRPHVPQKQQQLASSSTNSAASIIRNNLDNNVLWTVPNEEETDIVSVYKRRRLIWQDGLCSALARLKSCKIDVFYVISAGSRPVPATTSSIASSTAGVVSAGAASVAAVTTGVATSSAMLGSKYAGWNLSGIFCSKKFCSDLLSLTDKAVIPSPSVDGYEEHEEVCILVGVPRSFRQRMKDLGIKPQLITDQATFSSLQAHKERSNGGSGSSSSTSSSSALLSSAALLEKYIEGQSFVISGSAQVALAMDCLTEYFFSTQQAARVTADVPRIVCHKPFAGAVRMPLRLNVTSTFNPALVANDSDFGISSAVSTKDINKSTTNRLLMTGDILPRVITSLAAALVALGKSHHTEAQLPKTMGCELTTADLDQAALAIMLQSAPSSSAPLPLQPSLSSAAAAADAVTSGKNAMVKNPFNIIAVRNQQQQGQTIGGDSAAKVNGDALSQRVKVSPEVDTTPTFRIKIFSHDRFQDFANVCLTPLPQSLKGKRSRSDDHDEGDGLYQRCLNRVEEIYWHASNMPSQSVHAGKRQRRSSGSGAALVGSDVDSLVEFSLALNDPAVTGLSSIEGLELDKKKEIVSIGTGKNYDIYAE